MNRVKVTAEVRVYEHNGAKSDAFKVPPLVVRSHWNYDDWAVIEIGGKSYTVVRADLSAALRSVAP